MNVNERKKFEAFNREILGLNPPITARSTNVSSNDLKSHNMATARGCAILQNSHRLNQNMKQFFLKNVTDDPSRIINKIRKICFHGVFPFAKQRLSHLGTFGACLKKASKYHLFEIPISAYTELISNRDKLQIFGLDDLVRFSINFDATIPKSAECDRWITDPKVAKKERTKMMHEIGLQEANKIHFRAVNKIQTGEFSLVFNTHVEAVNAMRAIINHPKYDPKFFTATWDAALLKDPVLLELVKQKKENKKIFKSSYSRDAVKDNSLITRQGHSEELQHESQNFFQKLSAIYKEVVTDKSKKNLQTFLDLSNNKPIAEIKQLTSEKKNAATNTNTNTKSKKTEEPKIEEPQGTHGNKMQFWNVQYKLVLEALKANSYDSYKTATSLGITLRSLSKTILALKSKKYDLYLPEDYKIRVGIAEKNISDYKRGAQRKGKSNSKRNDKSQSVLEDDTNTYRKLKTEMGIEKYKKKQEAESAAAATNTE